MQRLPILVVLLHALSPVVWAADGDAWFGKTVKPFLAKHCLTCHGAKKRESGLRFDQTPAYRDKDSHLWTRVYEKITAGEMPPKGRPRPSAAERDAMLRWIVRQQRAGRTGGVRRLNRRELAAALRDVTGLAVDYADALPADGKVAGFDTGAAALQDTADSVAKTMEIARRAVNGIRFLEPARGTTLFADLRNDKDAKRVFRAWRDKGAYAKVRGFTRPGEGLLIEPKWLGERGGMEFHVPPTANRRGLLRVTIVVSAFKGEFDGIPNPHLWVKLGGRYRDYRELTPGKTETLTYLAQIEDAPVGKRGLGIALHNKVEMPYGVKGFANDSKLRPGEKIPGGPNLFRPAYDKKNKRLPPEKRPIPYVVLKSIKIETDYVAAWPPKSWNRTTGTPARREGAGATASEGTGRSARSTVGDITDSSESADRLLELWMNRAWRRPVTEKERERFLSFYRQRRKQGQSFDEALRSTFQSVLLSAPFRYLASPADRNPVVARHAIASRLSFMLTGAPPDAELRKLAAAGKLRDPRTLDAQVDRLLADPRSEAFFQPFVKQWLVLDQPITLVMDHNKQQDFRFGRFLKASMQNETIAYFQQLVADNRPAGELISSDWTMMNNSLARHYGYAGIEGGRLRKVKLKADDPRGGGILGHAGIQSMLCWMGDNWVIYRGAWTLRHILNAPPPPPPLEVPELNPADAKNRGKSFRQLLQQHQKNAKCAVCHRTIDPMGFAFQNFDISGRWRNVEHASYKRAELDGKIEWRGVGKTRPVDTAGRLPRGETFKTFAECKQLIVKNYRDDMVRGLLQNLMLYATGRRPDVADNAEILAMMKRHAKGGYRLRDLLKEVVRSKAFLHQ